MKSVTFRLPVKVKGNDGNAKLNDLYSKARRIYQKGYQVKELVASLDMSVIRKKNADVLLQFWAMCS